MNIHSALRSIMEDVMDNFMSRLSQKINTQDTIKANFMAETAEKEQLKKQLAEYDSMMRYMYNFYQKQEEKDTALKEVAEKLDKLLALEGEQQEFLAKLEAVGSAGEEQPELAAEIKDYISKSDEVTHKECVKVYRNVQALLDEQDKKFIEGMESLKAQGEALKLAVEAGKAKDMSGDFEELKRRVKKQNRSTKALLWLLLFISAANVATVLLIHYGLF